MPENTPFTLAWALCETQWMVGMNGPTGLRYEGCRAILEPNIERLHLPDIGETLIKLQTMETARLMIINEERDNDGD